MKLRVRECAEKLHSIFLRYFGGKTFHDIRLKHFNAQYLCPNKQCPTNHLGHHSYGKCKFSISFDIFKFHCWVCDDFGSISYLSKKYLSEIDQREVRRCGEILKEFFVHYKLDGKTFNVNQLLKSETEGFELLIDFDEDTSPFDLRRKRVLNYALKTRGLTYEHLYFYNLMFTRKGKYADLLIVPSYDEHHHLNFFIGRSIEKNAYFKFKKPEMHKSDIIFNEHLIDWKQQLILVEGPIDYLHLHGYNRTILDGSSLSKNSLLIRKLKYYKPTVKLLLDPDAESKAMDLEKKLKRFGIPTQITTKHLVSRGLSDAGELRGEQKIGLIQDVLNEKANTDIVLSLNHKLESLK